MEVIYFVDVGAGVFFPDLRSEFAFFSASLFSLNNVVPGIVFNHAKAEGTAQIEFNSE